MKKSSRTKTQSQPQKSPEILQNSPGKCLPILIDLIESPKSPKEVTVPKENQENQENKNVKNSPQEITTRQIMVRRDLFKNPLRVVRRKPLHRSISK